MMHKRFPIFALLIISSVLLFSCKEHAAETKVDPKVLAATVEKAMKAADPLDGLNARAYEFGQTGAAMAGSGVEGASQTLDSALAAAHDARSEAPRSALAALRSETAEWGPAEMEQIAPALDRMEKATQRVWVIGSIAEGIALTDRAKAMSVLADAAREADAIQDKRYRDLDLRLASAQMAALDAGTAYGVASKIADPRVKAWALTDISSAA